MWIPKFRFNRGLKKLEELLKNAQAGKPVNDIDIPPPVAIKTSQATSPERPDAAPPAPEPVKEVEPEPPISPEPKEPPPPPPRVESQGLDPARQQGLQAILSEFNAVLLETLFFIFLLIMD